MKFVSGAALLFAAGLGAAPALADRWVEPVNGTVSAVPMSSGEVMMRIQIPAKTFGMISRDMKAQHGTCTIKEIDPSSPDTMILVCGGS